MSEANPAGVTLLECISCEEKDARISELEAARLLDEARLLAALQRNMDLRLRITELEAALRTVAEYNLWDIEELERMPQSVARKALEKKT